MPRTIVNRLWHRLLGRGLVENPDDLDGEPWQPALLDWLASDFVDHGYDLKRLIATIVSSRAYQLPAIARTAQPAKVYTFRGPEIRRLTAEQFADAVASITGDWNVISPGAAGRERRFRPGRTPLRSAAGAIHARVAHRRESGDARAGPADSRSGVLHSGYDGDHAAGTRIGERRTAHAMALARRAPSGR
jgi:hypothetical protein